MKSGLLTRRKRWRKEGKKEEGRTKRELRAKAGGGRETTEGNEKRTD